jgi:large subunit ribosomal protein L4
MNRKERRKALFCALSAKLKNKQLIIIDDIKLKEIKTKSMVDVLNSFSYDTNVLLTLPTKNEVIEKSSANLPYVKSILVNYLNVKDLLKYKTLVLLKDSLGQLDTLTK